MTSKSIKEKSTKEIEVMGEAVSEWRAVGTRKTVIKSSGSWVSTIDDQPDMDVVKKYIGGEIIAENSSKTNIGLNTMYPFQVDRDGDSPGIVPTLEFNTDNKAVLCGQPMPEGTTFQFSLPPDFDVIDTIIQSSRKIKEQEMPEADAMIVFLCMGRFLLLGLSITNDIIKAHGGSLDLKSTKDEGTIIVIKLSLAGVRS